MPPARALIDAGAIVALATDFNPGSAYCESLPTVMNLACTQLGMSVGEALGATTVNAAWVLGRADRLGRLAPGYDADITNNHLPAFRTLRRLIARWVLELLEIVLICCHIHIVLGVEAFTARFAGLPGTSMTLMRVIGTERVAIVIAPTAIAGIRKHHIRVAIIAYPVVTTKRFG